jgi:hypothetical protein
VASGPDNAGTCQYCQMVRVRLARGRGIREESAVKPLNGRTGSNLVDMGRDRGADPPLMTGGELLSRHVVVGREAMLKVCGVGMAMPQGSSRMPPSSIGKQ